MNLTSTAPTRNAARHLWAFYSELRLQGFSHSVALEIVFESLRNGAPTK